MKVFMRKVFSPILNMFEAGEGDYTYRPSHRKILIILGGLCFVLSSGSVFLTISASELGGILPSAFFFITGLVCQIVALLGTDRAVARIWSRK